MHFILAKELAEIERWTLDQIAGLERLASCAFSGNHVVTIETPIVAERLLEVANGNFSAITIAVLKRCLARYSLQGALREYLKIVRYVVPRSAIDPPRNKGSVAIEDMQLMSLEPTTLLAENKIDAEIYEIAGRHYAVANRIKGVEVVCLPRGGGGNTVLPEFDAIISAGRQICLTITDGDQNWPGRPASPVSSGCEQLSREAPTYAGHIRLSVREVENLIPVDVAKEIVDAVEQGRVDLMAASIHSIPEIRICGDLKDGTSLRYVHKLDPNCAERIFLERVCVANGRTHRNCQDGCKTPEGSTCECIVVPKIANNLSIKFKTWLEERSPHKSLELFKHEWRESWLEVGEVVLHWCSALPPTRG